MSFGNAAKSGFSLDDLTKMGPDEITRKRKIAEALLAQSQGIHPIANPLEGMAQMAQALIGNLKGARLDRAEREGKEGANALFSASMGMGEFPPAPGAKPSGNYSGVADGPKGQEAYAVPAKANVPANAKDLAGSFIKMGYTPAQAAGIVGNLVQESGLRSTGAVGDSGTAFGLAQWRGDRFTNLKNFAAQQGKSWEDPDVQAQFIHHELGTSEKTAGDRLRAAKTPEEAAAAFIGFERPKGWTPENPTGGHGWSNRLANTMGIVGQLGDVQPADPTQVASLDPAIGMPPAANAMLPPAPGAPGQEAIAKALLGPTGYDPAKNPMNARVDGMMANGGAGLNPPPEVAAIDPAQAPLPTPAAPNVVPPGAPAAQAPLPQQQQMAQALIQPQDPAMTLGAPAIQPGGPDMRTLMNMAGNEFMSPQQQKMIEALTGQRMKQADPEYKMGLEKSRLELDALKNPKMSPSQQAEYDLNVQKFGVEQADRIAKQADTDADNKRADAELDLKRKEGLTTGNIKDYEAYKRDEVNAGRTPLGRLQYEQELRKSGASSTNVDISGGTGKQVFDAVAASAEKATQAAAGFSAVQEANKALDAGIISGSGADMRLGLQKLGAFFGADPTTIQNTETFRSAIAPQIAAVMKATVGNVQISDADREFAEKAAGGSIALEAGSIKRLMKIMEKMSRATIDRHQKILDKVYPETPDGKFDRERALFGIDPLPETAEPGSGESIDDIIKRNR